MELTASARARQILQRVFRGYPGSLAVRLWDGVTLSFGAGAPEVTLIVHEPRLLRNLILFRDPLRLAEAYFQGWLDVEGDLYTALKMRDHLQTLNLSVFEKADFLFAALFIGGASASVHAAPALRSFQTVRPWRAHSKGGSREAIAFHYDVSNAFYRLWLDEQMIYSCAYFETPDDSLDQAQCNKLDHICRKLRLKPGERLLDIGCGWGALIRWAAKHYGVQAHGITLSRNQYDYALENIRDEGLHDRVTVELRDYRELQGEARYDKIASVGMFEHVGLKNLPRYFDLARRLLRPGGLFLNQGITQDREGWGESVGTRFINRYVFPDGELDTVGNVQRVMEHAGFEILDVEALRRHYALTLRHWVERLESRKAEAQSLVPESIYRLWRLYMAACALQFEQGTIGVYQILAATRDGSPDRLRLTWRDLYD
ncbi:class I SAM-dependent methyltransferase [Sedimenticola hydrogenitrophicus]|uniref:class I SAM-dependent methyltransferase n=1 Tax=Sedimenticola hydrogenitrophicus TaxID=2967975 RepID=UPI0023B0AF36|nr:class I SAM-dependent methyltransferase [Sedimenticola hydrogenitrophicus]